MKSFKKCNDIFVVKGKSYCISGSVANQEKNNAIGIELLLRLFYGYALSDLKYQILCNHGYHEINYLKYSS